MIFLNETVVEKDATKPHAFTIKGRNLNRVFELSAESEDLANEWVEKLNQAISKQ